MLSKLTENSYHENDKTFISKNVPHFTNEQNASLTEQGNNQIYNRACLPHENEQILEKEHSQITENLTYNLTKSEYCQTIFRDSLRQMPAETCSKTATHRTRNEFKENLKKCQFCRGVFPDSLFAQHIKTCNRKKMHACSTCNKVFRVVSKLRVHEQSHSEERLHSCKICAKPFKFKSGLSRHIKQQHSGIETNEPNTSLCDELQELEYASLQDDNEQSFEEEHLRRTGLKTSRIKEYGPLQEDLKHQKSRGRMVVNGAGNDKRNRVKTHSDKTNLVASSCEKNSFSHKDESLVQGDDYFGNVVSQNDRCQSKGTTCNVGDRLNLNRSDEGDLKQNNSYDNSDEEMSKISAECFANPLASVTMQSCVQNKVYKCQECPRMFEKPSRLEMHRRTHSDEKIFNCELCYQTFKYKGSLNRHIREQHYGQGRKCLSSTLDVKQRNEQESYFSVGESRFDRFLTDVTESSDGAFRHWKERHYSQERMSFNMVCEEVKPQDCPSLEKKNFKNAKCLDESLEDEVNGRLKREDVKSKSFSKTVDKTELNKLQNCPALEENECQNNDVVQDKSSREISNEGGSNSSVARNKRQDSSHDIGKNNSDLEEHQMQRQKKQLMNKFNEKQEDTRNMSSRKEESSENVADTRECESYENEENNFEENSSDIEENNLSMVFQHRQRDTEIFDENDFENLKQDCESNLEESNFEREENNLEVTSKDNEDFKGKVSVNTQNDGVGKIYQCDVCEKVFVKRSTWSNHKRTHNDDMSYACEICWKYFKYKGSLSRHIKEQHYGLGRKDQRNYNISHNSSLVGDYFDIESQTLGPNMNEIERESPGNTTSSSSKEYNLPIKLDTSGTVLNQLDKRESDLNARSVVYDKTPRGDTPCSSILPSPVNDSKDDYDDSKSSAGTDAEIDDGKGKSSDVNRNEQNIDEALLIAANLSVPKKEDLKENECLQNAELEKITPDSRPSKSDLSGDKLQNSPGEITCEVCGRCFKHKGSLKRHVKEQHYGLGRKSFKANVDEIQRQVDCSKAMAVDEEAVDCTNGSGNCTLVMPSFANEGNQNCCSSLAKLSPQNKAINLGKTVNDVLQIDDNFRKETFELKRSYVEMKSGEHSEKVEVEGKYESFEEADFELKKANKQSILRPRDDLKKKNDNAQVNLNQSDQEPSNVNTRQENFDASDGNIKKVYTRKENQSHAKKGRKCKKANFFPCDECPKILPNRALLRKHKRVHSNDMSFSCEICQQTFKYKGSLNRHVKEQHYGMGRKGIRNMSDERIEANNSCLSVENVYNPKPTDCKDGSFEGQNFELEKFELKEKRLATKQAGNYINSTTSKTWKFYSQHRKNNSQHREGTSFENKQENFLHDDGPDLAHNKIELKPNVDTKQSEFDSYRVEHFEKTKMHKCPECPKLFWNISDLREHTYKHTSVKYFACELCVKAFKFRSGLVRHKRKEHKKFDNIPCESRAGVIDENGFGEDAAFEKNRDGFESEDCTMFREQVELNKGLKKQFSESTRGYETVVGGTGEKSFGNKDSGSEFEKDVESNELLKIRGNSFKADIDKRSEMEKDCLNFEVKKTALKDEHQSFDVDAKHFTKRSFLEIEKDEKSGKEKENFAIKKISVRQNVSFKKKSAMYNCNKCDAVFKQLCDFLTHQSIHK